MYQSVIPSTLISLFLFPLLGYGQHEWQKPKPLIPLEKVNQIIGPLKSTVPSKPVQILWVWGYDKPHRPGTHDYLKVRDLFVGLLKKVPNVSVETVYGFPTDAQFKKSQLVVFYLHLPQLTAKQYASFQGYIQNGGGVVALHETAIMRPANEGQKLAQCLGMAWDEGRSKWGAVFEDVTIKNEHKIFKGFGPKFRVADEFYWNLNRLDGVEVLGSVRTGPPNASSGPLPETRLSKTTSPVFWTIKLGKGRVFGTTLGHNTFSYYDPEFRIVLFRAMAWSIKESPDPFMPLVCDGITNNQKLVGTTDDMRDWKGKLREPPIRQE